ncbi:indolepyruvate oxidoreductase subunit beta [Desulfosediminicola flagellatus]|uniref:indolepyruvate oxidoreductase subunit beta n=1 Tax=Desulfosediminicola flagellatus TaxID=2569541 RepID=UPI0010AC6462|nr:indolepyruvate oxidoreductase subunit beta [Desulfosediminicola flagellatus]
MQTKRVFFVGVGGQGNILATKLVGEAAVLAGTRISISETHGMAQRGGVVESTAVIGGASPIISDSEADVIVAFEPLEALRALRKANPKTILITSLAQIQPFTVSLGQGEYPALDKILQLLEDKVDKVVAFDAMELARSAGNPLGVNMVMLGALMAVGDINLPEEYLREAISTKTKAAFVEANLQCFDAGLETARRILG